MKIDIHAVLKDAIKELPDTASREQVLAYIDAAIAKVEAIEGKPEPEVEEVAPMADPPMPAEEPKEAAMTGAPAPAAAPAAPSMAAAEPPMAAVDAEAGAVIGLVADALGLSVAETLALMRDRASDIGMMLKGTPANGMPAESAALSAANTANRTLTLSVDVAKARVTALEKQAEAQAAEITTLRGQVAETRVAGLAREIDESIRCGHFLPADKPLLLSLAKSDEGALREHLTRAAAAPKVPTGRVSSPSIDGDLRSVGESGSADDAMLRASLKAAGMSETKIEAHMKSRTTTTKINGRA